MSELWLIRHGETDWNRTRRMQGSLNVGLNALGRSQADQVAARLGTLAASETFHAIYSSDLDRAHTTAKPAAAALGLEITLDPGLRERNYGVMQGLDRQEIDLLLPEAAAAWKSRDPDREIPGGETLRAFHDRVVGTLARIGVAHRGQRVLIFTHGGVLDIAYRHATGVGFAAERNHLLLNASINRIVLDSDTWQVVEWANDSHLTEAADEVSPY
ncbi:histidine phosphatase family protein [Pigmentiphaga aceris]|uniref:Histidine phosphatase family protein n=1 Tax=Pigmentiphaga aceris TaxID=1940612 RepID=A0A5C0ATV7_9BURK|nr:histidine phosphatase family protein [Pigmentiphaga aceris]QEI05104.1 histidine phosphatase family protein [Pigmentiphaga aceris]